MTVSITISDAAKAQAEALVASGRYASIGQAVEAAIWRLDATSDDEEVYLDDLSPEDRAAVEEGLADMAAGRLSPADEVFDRLIAKYGAMARRA